VRSHRVVVLLPDRQRLSRVGERCEQGPVEELVAQPAVEALDEGVLLGLAGCDVVPFDLPLLRPTDQRRIAMLVSSVPLSETIIAGQPRVAISAYGFNFALLDDVVMSVDAGHRYQFCKLLKTYFPNTQFVITTHDRLWAEQMRSAGLVTLSSSLALHSWTIDTGPLVESNAEIWDESAAMLSRGKVETASHASRHHLEYVSRHLADQLGAAPAFRADGNYELGELLPSGLARIKFL
jgi:hypothetical protein